MSWLGNLFGVAPAKPHTGKILAAVEIWELLPKATLGKATYAEVRDEYLIGLCGRAHLALSENVGGITSWKPDATCTLFAANAVALAAQEYYAAAFHDDGPAPALAVGEFWFIPAGGSSGHAIVVFVTPSGLRFVDPQVPAVLRDVTPAELSSCYNARFL